MSKIINKTRIITDTIIVLLIVVVFTFSFIPETIIPISSGSENSAIYHGNVKNKNVSLMFNVYENSEVVEKIIQTLNSYDVKATFFVGGCWADDNEKTLNSIVKSGNEIANHGYFHKDHKKLSYEKNYEEISLTGKIIKALCGVEPVLFAPPSGSFNENTLASASDLGYKVIMWSKDTIDWRDSDTETIFNRASKNPSNGDLILMHPKEHTLNVLPKIIEFYKNLGYNIVTVSQNIS